MKKAVPFAVIGLLLFVLFIGLFVPVVGQVTSMDSDFDGLTNTMEKYYGTAPQDRDTDDDGVLDGDEKDWNIDTDGDGLINALDPDSDNDGLTDGTEMGVVEPIECFTRIDGTNTSTTFVNSTRLTFTADTDNTTITDMLNNDTDGDGLFDGWDDANGNGILDNGEAKGEDLNYNGNCDPSELDPQDGDTEDDGVPDGYSVNGLMVEGYLDSDGDGIANGQENDSDDDGILDCIELGITVSMLTDDTNVSKGNFSEDQNPKKMFNSDPTKSDTDEDGIPDGVEDKDRNGAIAGDENYNYVLDPGEVWLETNPINNDTDNDGMPDGDNGSMATGVICEDKNNNGLVDDLETNPCDPDTDDDGLLDGWENNDGTYENKTSSGTCPLNPDTDGDNLKDGVEVDLNSNPLMADSDSDNMPDIWEYYQDFVINDPNDAALDPDEDGFTNLEEYLGADGVPGGNDSTNPKDGESHPPIEKESGDNGGGDLMGSITDNLVTIVLIIIVIIMVLVILAIAMKKGKEPQAQTRVQPTEDVIPGISLEGIRLSYQQRLDLLHKRFSQGELTQEVYNDLRGQIESQRQTTPQHPQQHQPPQQPRSAPAAQQTYIPPPQRPPPQQPPTQQQPQQPQQPPQKPQQQQTVPCPTCQKPIAVYSSPCAHCGTELNW